MKESGTGREGYLQLIDLAPTVLDATLPMFWIELFDTVPDRFAVLLDVEVLKLFEKDDDAAAVAATGLPVSIDLENGFGDAPEDAAETIRLAAATGAVGGSIEDRTRRADDPIYDRALAAETVIRTAIAAIGAGGAEADIGSGSGTVLFVVRSQRG